MREGARARPTHGLKFGEEIRDAIHAVFLVFNVELFKLYNIFFATLNNELPRNEPPNSKTQLPPKQLLAH